MSRNSADYRTARARSIGLVAAAWILLSTGCVPVEGPGGSERSTVQSDPPPDAADLPAFAAGIPAAEIPELDREMALTLAAMPLSCLDRPHAASRDRRTYLDTIVATRVPGFVETRAFYGCWDLSLIHI